MGGKNENKKLNKNISYHYFITIIRANKRRTISSNAIARRKQNKSA